MLELINGGVTTLRLKAEIRPRLPVGVNPGGVSVIIVQNLLLIGGKSRRAFDAGRRTPGYTCNPALVNTISAALFCGKSNCDVLEMIFW